MPKEIALLAIWMKTVFKTQVSCLTAALASYVIFTSYVQWERMWYGIFSCRHQKSAKVMRNLQNHDNLEEVNKKVESLELSWYLLRSLKWWWSMRTKSRVLWYKKTRENLTLQWRDSWDWDGYEMCRTSFLDLKKPGISVEEQACDITVKGEVKDK